MAVISAEDLPSNVTASHCTRRIGDDAHISGGGQGGTARLRCWSELVPVAAALVPFAPAAAAPVPVAPVAPARSDTSDASGLPACVATSLRLPEPELAGDGEPYSASFLPTDLVRSAGGDSRGSSALPGGWEELRGSQAQSRKALHVSAISWALRMLRTRPCRDSIST